MTLPDIPLIHVEPDVVNSDIPARLGLDVLDRESLTVDNVATCLTNRVKLESEDAIVEYADAWSVPVRRSKSTHIYANMWFPPKTFFPELNYGSSTSNSFIPQPKNSSICFAASYRARPRQNLCRHWRSYPSAVTLFNRSKTLLQGLRYHLVRRTFVLMSGSC